MPEKLKELDRGKRDQNAAADERSINSGPAVLQP
jgi:hypothetical protein